MHVFPPPHVFRHMTMRQSLTQKAVSNEVILRFVVSGFVERWCGDNLGPFITQSRLFLGACASFPPPPVFYHMTMRQNVAEVAVSNVLIECFFLFFLLARWCGDNL